jgi:hypothetical protein
MHVKAEHAGAAYATAAAVAAEAGAAVIEV